MEEAPLRGSCLEHARRDQPDRGSLRRAPRDADVERLHLAGVGLAGVDPQARLGGVEADGDRRAHRRAATTPVEASTPLGTSTLTTERAGALIASIASATAPRGSPWKPVPSSASTMSTSRANTPAAVAMSLARLLSRLRPGLPVQAHRRRARQALEVRARVPGELCRRRHAHDGHRSPGLAQQARDDEPIAAVVALAAYDRHGPIRREALERACDAGAGALHQIEARHAALLDRPAIDGAHRLGVGKRRAATAAAGSRGSATRR